MPYVFMSKLSIGAYTYFHECTGTKVSGWEVRCANITLVLLKTDLTFHFDCEKCHLSSLWVISGSPQTLPAPTPLLVPLISPYSSNMVLENSKMSQGIWALTNAPIHGHLMSCAFPTCSWAAAHAIQLCQDAFLAPSFSSLCSVLLPAPSASVWALFQCLWAQAELWLVLSAKEHTALSSSA